MRLLNGNTSKVFNKNVGGVIRQFPSYSAADYRLNWCQFHFQFFKVECTVLNQDVDEDVLLFKLSVHFQL